MKKAAQYFYAISEWCYGYSWSVAKLRAGL